MFACFVSADWSKEPKKRSVYVAHVEQRRIRRACPGPSGWNLDTLLAFARELSNRGMVLIGVDLALGVSRGYWRLVLEACCRYRSSTFVDWLRDLDPSGEFFQTTTEAEQWRVDRPWFHVPPGEGSLGSFTKLVDDRFLRPIDKATQAKPLFAVSGIPGTVGSGTRDFWKELIPPPHRRTRLRDLALRGRSRLPSPWAPNRACRGLSGSRIRCRVGGGSSHQSHEDRQDKPRREELCMRSPRAGRVGRRQPSRPWGNRSGQSLR